MGAIKTQYLDGQYYTKNPSFHVEDSAWKAGYVLKMLAGMLCNPSSVAEVGCGAGEILVQLSSRLPDARFFGYELSPQGYQLCRQRESARVTYFNDDLLTRTGERYDLILCIDVLEHVEDYFTFLRTLQEYGSAFIFHIPLDMNAQMVARNTPMAVRGTAGHLHYFSKDTALATLEECGYDVRSWFYTPSGADRPKGAKSKALQIPRRASSHNAKHHRQGSWGIFAHGICGRETRPMMAESFETTFSSVNAGPSTHKSRDECCKRRRITGRDVPIMVGTLD